MKTQRNSFLFILLLVAPFSRAQETVYRLSSEHLLAVVRAYHPVIKQTGLQIKRAESEIQTARGSFDPTVSAELKRKAFTGKLYYSYFNPEITIPTWYGVDIKAGIQEVLGERLSPEATFGQTSYLGVTLSPGSLLFDKRRAILRQAGSLKRLTEAEQELIAGEILYMALSAYWNWTKEYLIYNVAKEAVKVGEDRVRFVRIEYEQGARPAIDTIEAVTQLQNLYFLENSALLAFQNAGIELSAYLWLENDRPVVWSNAIRPAEQEIDSFPDIPLLENLLSFAAGSHPKLRSLGHKRIVLETEKWLMAQSFFPRLNLSANLLGSGYAVPPELWAPFHGNNYTLGADLSIPLFFREARGAYRTASLKVKEIALEQDLTVLQVENKLKSYYNELVMTAQQIKLYEQVLSNNIKLFQGERLRFESGESTLFVLNSRENKVLETRQKLFELKAKWFKSYAGLLLAAGVLFKP